jgi:excinuclease UvrABC nuclease subunit
LTRKEQAKALVAAPKAEYLKDPKLIDKEIGSLRKKMKKASDQLEFEEAARIRDDVKRLELIQLSLLDGDVDRDSSKVMAGQDAAEVVVEHGEGSAAVAEVAKAAAAPASPAKRGSKKK